MKLQIALDVSTIEEAIDILNEVHEYVDIAEIGTVGDFNGLKAITEVKRAFPQLEVLSDMKIYDGGEYTAMAAFNAGADYVSVMGVADDVTIKGVLNAAHRMNRRVVADMITVQNFVERVKQVDRLGVDFIAVHLAVDLQSVENTPLEQLAIAKIIIKNAGIAIAGGINRNNIKMVIKETPDIIIVGSGIYNQSDKRACAQYIKSLIRKKGDVIRG
jgi:3-hexulose-6-phosphate synthase